MADGGLLVYCVLAAFERMHLWRLRAYVVFLAEGVFSIYPAFEDQLRPFGLQWCILVFDDLFWPLG